ncbi:sodium-dependent glucose transporter 1A-like [Dermacentor andersoni]|uniref:sodium-dependent glucose transporter 1A-like n=1 Tax=Dermacentor andersoni TaxID=34620 RepID=UPI00215583B5|nr:sodium-dependent glucose transporter 1A-like [Dermacentor andersoni]
MPTQARLWLNLGRTFNLGLGNLGMGLSVALTGVALLDLVEIYDASVSSVSYLITTRGIGNLIGSLLGGKLYDTYNTQVISILTMILSSITVLVVPLSGYLAVAHVMVFFEGLSLGAFGTGANVWIIRMWPENSSPALQAFHLAFGIGGLIAPFIAKPFLSPVAGGNSSSILNHTFGMAEQAYLTANHTSDLSKELLELGSDSGHGSGKSQVHYAFAIASALNILLVISMIVLYFVDRADFKPQEPSNTDPAEAVIAQPASAVRFTRTVLAMLCAYVCVYVVLECSSSEMFATFAVKSDLHFTKEAASRVVAVYFFCFSAGRLSAVLLTIKVSVFWIIIASHIVLLPTAVVLAMWGSSRATVLWLGSALTGFAQGPLNAGVTAWTAKYISITNKMMSLVVVTGGVGSMSPPLLVGQFLESSPDVFLYVCLAAASLCIVVFVTMCVYVREATRSNESEVLLESVNHGSSQDSLSPPIHF